MSNELAINRHIDTIRSAARDNVVTLLDHFKHSGPNGEHDCLVFEPMGPDVARFERSVPDPWRKAVSKQLLTALNYLHEMGVVHSDTNPGNLHFSLTQPIESPSVKGRSMSTRIDGNRDQGVPTRIYEDRPLTEFWDSATTIKLKLSDLGAGKYQSLCPLLHTSAETRAAFLSDNPPKQPLIAVGLRPPEVVLQMSFDHTVDIWSFGCYLFEIFTGQPLFDLPPVFGLALVDDDDLDQTQNDGGSNDEDGRDDDHLLQMITNLGPLPLAMFEKWPRRRRYYDTNMNIVRTDVGQSDIPLGPVHIGATLKQRLKASWLPERTAEELVDLVHVLERALEYDPTRRPSATELLCFDWFNCAYDT